MPNEPPETILTARIASFFHRNGAQALTGIEFAVGRGDCLAVIGPNGSGKTSLLTALLRSTQSGLVDIQLLGQALSRFTLPQRARHVAILSQHEDPDRRLILGDYVALGRLPHLSTASPAIHRAIVERAIRDVGLSSFTRRTLGSLSGGELQRAALARVFAQTPDLLLLDELTNHLDHTARAELLALVKQKSVATVAVLHDLPLVESFADRVLLLREGKQVICGSPAQVLTTKYLYPVFGLKSFTLPHPVTGKVLRIFETPEYI